jgi:tetratricopeptide (TPR) repeat protein
LLEELIQRSREAADIKLEVSVLHSQAVYQRETGNWGVAEQLLADALSLAERHQDRDAELICLITLGEVLADTGSAEASHWILNRAEHLAHALRREAASSRILDVRGRLAKDHGDSSAALTNLSRAVVLSRQAGLETSSALSFLHLGQVHLSRGQMNDASACFASAFEHAKLAGHPTAVSLGGIAAGYCNGFWVGRPEYALAVVEQMRGGAAGECPTVRAHADALHAVILARDGKLRDSISLLDEADALCSRIDFRYFALRNRIRFLIGMGLLDEADSLCTKLLDADDSTPHLGEAVAHLHALIARAGGDDARALDEITDCVAHMSDSSPNARDLTLDAAWLCLEGGRTQDAEQILAKGSAFADRYLAEGYGPALLVRAGLEFALGNSCEAVGLQRRYCEIFQCDPQTEAAQSLSIYEESASRCDDSWRSTRVPRVTAVPSMFDFAPGMGLPGAPVGEWSI